MVSIGDTYEQKQLLIAESVMMRETSPFLILILIAFGLSAYSWLGLGGRYYTDIIAGALAFTIFFSLAFYSITTLELAWLAILTTMFGLVQMLFVFVKVFAIFKDVAE